MSKDLFDDLGEDGSLKPLEHLGDLMLNNDVESAQEALLVRMQEMMKTVPGPPSLALSRMSCTQMLESWNLNKNLVYVGPVGYINENDTPKVNFINSGYASEKVAELSMKIVTKYVQNETASMYTFWREQEKETSSARKRRLYNGISPGRRLSHLARRRQIFSRANLQQMSQNEPKHRIAIRKPDVSCNIGKGFENVRAAEGVKILPKRALFQSPDEPPVRAGYKTMPRQVPRRRLFDSADQGEQCLPGGGGSYDVSGWLASQSFSNARKRCHDDPREGDSKRRCPRRSLDFSVGSPSRSSDSGSAVNSVEAMPSMSSSHITSVHKQKLLWVVAIVLKERNITLKDKNFKYCASALYNVCKKNLPAILSAEVNKRTSEKVLDFARLQVDCIVGDLVQKTENDCPKKPLAEVPPSALNKEAEVRESPCKGKENVVKTPQRKSRVRNWQSGLKQTAAMSTALQRCSSLGELQDYNINLTAKALPAPAVKRKWEAVMVEATPEKSIDNPQICQPYTSQLIEETPEKSGSDDDLEQTPSKCLAPVSNNSCNALEESCVPASEDDSEEAQPFPALIKNIDPPLPSFTLNETDLSQEIPLCDAVSPFVLEQKKLDEEVEIETNDLFQYLPAVVPTEPDEVDGNPEFTLGDCSNFLSTKTWEETIPDMFENCVDAKFSDELAMPCKSPVPLALDEIEPDMFAPVLEPNASESIVSETLLKTTNGTNHSLNPAPVIENSDSVDENEVIGVEKEADVKAPLCDAMECEELMGENGKNETVSLPGDKLIDSEESDGDEPKIHTSTPSTALKKRLVKKPAWKIETGPGLKIRVRLSSEWDIEGRPTPIGAVTATPNSSLEGSSVKMNTSLPVNITNEMSTNGDVGSCLPEPNSSLEISRAMTSPATSMESYTLMELKDRLAIESTLLRDESELDFDPSGLSDNVSIDSMNETANVLDWMCSSSAAITDAKAAADATPKSSDCRHEKDNVSVMKRAYARPPRKSTPSKWKSGCNVVAVADVPEVTSNGKRDEIVVNKEEIIVCTTSFHGNSHQTEVESEDDIPLSQISTREEIPRSGKVADVPVTEDVSQKGKSDKSVVSKENFKQCETESDDDVPLSVISVRDQISKYEETSQIKAPSLESPKRQSNFIMRCNDAVSEDPSDYRGPMLHLAEEIIGPSSVQSLKPAKDVPSSEEIETSKIDDNCRASLWGTPKMNGTTPCSSSIKTSSGSSGTSDEKAKRRLSIDDYKARKKLDMDVEGPASSTKIRYITLKKNKKGKSKDVPSSEEIETPKIDDICRASLGRTPKMNETTPCSSSIRTSCGGSGTSDEKAKRRLSIDDYKARKKLNMDVEEPASSTKIRYITLKKNKEKSKRGRKKRYSTDSECARPAPAISPEICYKRNIQTVVNAFHVITSTVEQEMKLTVAAVPDIEQRCCKLKKLGKVNEFTKGILYKFTSAYES